MNKKERNEKRKYNDDEIIYNRIYIIESVL